jgi:hypothetical protein
MLRDIVFRSKKRCFGLIPKVVEVQMEKNLISKISPLFDPSSKNAVKCFFINFETKLVLKLEEMDFQILFFLH